MNKRGQIYIVTALIIAGLILSLGTVYNFAKTPQTDPKVFDLSDEIDFETTQVIDRGIFQEENSADTLEHVSKLTKHYSETIKEEELYIIYGDSNGLYYAKKSAGDNEAPVFKELIGDTDQNNIVQDKNKITIIFDNGASHTFKLKEKSQNFYIVLVKEIDGEKFVASSDSENIKNNKDKSSKNADDDE